MLVLLAGVSGAGKDTIKKAIIQKRKDIISVPSFTTRQPREGDIPGLTYNFVDMDEFKRMISDEELLEYNFHHNNFYGTSKKLMLEKLKEGNIIIKDIDVDGVSNLVRILKDEIKVITIFLKVPRNILIERIKERDIGISDKEVELRISRMDYEESKIPEFDYCIENSDLNKTLEKIENIIDQNK